MESKSPLLAQRAREKWGTRRPAGWGGCIHPLGLVGEHRKILYSGRLNRPTRALYRGSERIGSNEG